MAKRIAFLFGAGASKGASILTKPEPPPVMKDLYDKLAEQFPDEWGPTSRLGSHADAFRRDFEKAFTDFVLQMPNNVSFWDQPFSIDFA